MQDRKVCACFSVGRRAIEQAIIGNRLTTCAQVGAAIQVGTSCGSCVPEIEETMRMRMCNCLGRGTRERVMAGLAGARAEGKKLRRKRTDRSIERKIERALSRRDRGLGKIAKDTGAGAGTVQRIKADLVRAGAA